MAISQNVKQSLLVVIGCAGLAASRPSSMAGQTAPTPPPPPPAKVPGTLADPAIPPTQEDKRILGVLPNYRTAEMPTVYTPIPAKYKLQIAVKDSFDYP